MKSESTEGYYHSKGPGFKTKLEQVFSRYRAGKSAESLLNSGDFAKGAVYVPSYCLAVSPYVKGLTRRTRIEPLFYPYSFFDEDGEPLEEDQVYWEPGVTRINWQLPSISGTVLQGFYHIVVAASGAPIDAPEAEHWVVKGEGTEWFKAQGADLELKSHRNNRDFERLPSNVYLIQQPKGKVERLLKWLDEDKYTVRNIDFPALTEGWIKRTTNRISIPDQLREIVTVEDNKQELSLILMDGLEKFSSAQRPRTTWTKWAELYGSRGIHRKLDGLTNDSNDVNRVKRFASHYPNVTDPEELRRLWILSYALKQHRKEYPHLSEVELTSLINIDEEPCSISLDNFKKAVSGTTHTISIQSTTTSDSDTLTIADRLEAPDDVFNDLMEDEYSHIIESMLLESGVSAEKVMAGVTQTHTGFKMDSKTKSLLFSPWLEDGETWKEREDRNKAIGRAYADLTTQGRLRSPEAIAEIWQDKKINTPVSLEQLVKDSVSDLCKEILSESRYSFEKGIYILASTGVLSKELFFRPDLIHCAKEIMAIFVKRGHNTESDLSKLRSDKFYNDFFTIVYRQRLTLEGFQIIMTSPLDLQATIRTLDLAGLIGKPKLITPQEARLTRLQKVLPELSWVSRETDPSEFQRALDKVRGKMLLQESINV